MFMPVSYQRQRRGCFQRQRRGIWQPGASAKRSGARRPWINVQIRDAALKGRNIISAFQAFDANLVW